MLYTAQAIGNCVYSCNDVLLYTAQGIVCTAVFILLLYIAQGIVCKAVPIYCYMQHRKLYVQLYCLLLYTAQGIVCTAVLTYYYIQHRQYGNLCAALLAYRYIQHRELFLPPYWCTVIYSTANME
jgi:hypothetical protein